MKKLIIILLAVVLLNCGEEEITSRPYPRVRTHEVHHITSTGATLHGEITFANTDVLDHGFFWAIHRSPSNGDNKISLGPKEGKGVFEAVLDRNLEEGKKYYVIAYAISADHLVYGDVVEFVSLGTTAPELRSISPVQAHWGDTVFFKGKNFPKNPKFTVAFDDVTVTPISIRDTLVAAIVPDNLFKKTSSVSVTFIGNTATLENQFELLAPEALSLSKTQGRARDVVTMSGKGFNRTHTKVWVGAKQAVVTKIDRKEIVFSVPSGLSKGIVSIEANAGPADFNKSIDFMVEAPFVTGFTPLTATFGDEIIIQGEYFSTNGNLVTFGGLSAEIVAESTTELRVKIPMMLNVPECKINVTSYSEQTQSNGMFKLLPVKIYDVTPAKTFPGDVLTITGDYFNPDGWNMATIDGHAVEILEWSKTELKVVMTEFNTTNTPLLSVTAGGSVASKKISSSWARTTEAPVNEGGIDFFHNGKLYSGLGGTNWLTAAMFSFDITSGKFQQLSDFPGGERYGAFYFKIGNKGYVGGGRANFGSPADFWEYDFATDTWEPKADLPLPDGMMSARGFAVGNKGFVMYGAAMWEYDVSSNTWTSKPEFPGMFGMEDKGFAFDGSLYITGMPTIGSHQGTLHKYDPTTGAWTFVANTPFEFEPSFFLVFDDAVYIGGYDERQFIKYDPATNTFTTLPPYPGIPRWNPAAVVVNGIGYLFGGGNFSGWPEPFKFVP